MIPKRIHYCWFGGKPLPYLTRFYIKSWKRMCPDYEIVRWDEENFDVFQHEFPASAYSARAWAFVSDWARLKIVHDYGGVYLDTDIELLKSLDMLLDNRSYIGVQQDGCYCTTGLGFGSEKYNPVIKDMLDEYDGQVFTWERANEFACPLLNDKVIRAYGYSGNGKDEIAFLDGITVYPSRFLDPIAPGKQSENLLCNESISISHYSNSWGSASKRARRALINIIGPGRVDGLKRMFGR